MRHPRYTDCPPVALSIPSQKRNVSLSHLLIMADSVAICTETSHHDKFFMQFWLKRQIFALKKAHKPKSESKLCCDRRSVGQYILVSSPPSGAYDQILITVRHLLICCCVWRENGCVVYNCCWASPAQSFSEPNPAGLRSETSPTWRTRCLHSYAPGRGWSSYTSRHWVPFSSPPASCRATVEVLEPTSMQGTKYTFFLDLLFPYEQMR
jgi:hypothetical protein